MAHACNCIATACTPSLDVIQGDLLCLMTHAETCCHLRTVDCWPEILLVPIAILQGQAYSSFSNSLFFFPSSSNDSAWIANEFSVHNLISVHLGPPLRLASTNCLSKIQQLRLSSDYKVLAHNFYLSQYYAFLQGLHTSRRWYFASWGSAIWEQTGQGPNTIWMAWTDSWS